MDDVVDVEARFKNEGGNNGGQYRGEHKPGQPDPSAKRLQTLKNLSWISYGLHLIVAVAAVIPGTQVGVGLLLVAMMIDWVKKPDAEGTWLHSHFAWRLRSVIWAGVLYVVTTPLWLLLFIPGWIAWCVISLWLVYRILRGVACMYDAQPVTR